MKRKTIILLALALLVIALPAMLGYNLGLQKANQAIQGHPEQFADPEKLRTDLAGRYATGGFLLGTFIVIWMVVSQALIKGMGNIVSWIVLKIKGLSHRTKRGWSSIDLLTFFLAAIVIAPVAKILSSQCGGVWRKIVYLSIMLIGYPLLGVFFIILRERSIRYFLSKKNGKQS